MLQLAIGEWTRLSDAISKLHELPRLLPEEWIKGTLVPTIGTVTAVLTIIYMVAYTIVEMYLPKDAPAIKKTKISYQITNIIFNIFVGIVGLYLEYTVLPTLGCFTGTSLDRIPLNHTELYLVSAMQLGYQFWAIPVGLFYVRESTEMLMHHVAVVVSTSLSGFCTVGFCYYTPFFYGVMELSSLPLSLMNSFKDNPEWIKKYPGVYSATRVVFAVSFLVIRVFMCASRWIPFLRDNFIFMYTEEIGLFKLYLLIQWSLAAFLAYLQLFWATLILSGIVKMVTGGKKKPKKE